MWCLVRAVHFFTFLTLLFFLVALGISYWSTSTARNNIGEEKPVHLGLWKICSDLQLTTGGSIVSEISNCRIGHCTRRDLLVRSSASKLPNLDLCEKCKASAAFLIIGSAAILAAFYHSSLRGIRGLEPNLLWAEVFQIIGFLCAIISLAVWVSWQEDTNSNALRETGDVSFEKFRPGAGLVLLILGIIMTAAVAIMLHCLRSMWDSEDDEAFRRSSSKRPLQAQDDPLENPVYAAGYDDDDDEGISPAQGDTRYANAPRYPSAVVAESNA